MDRYILPALGKLPVRQVDAATLDAFYARLRTRGGKDGRPLKASTVHEVHAVLSGALKQAVVWGWVGHTRPSWRPPIGREGRRAAAAGRGRCPAPVDGERGEPGAGLVPAPGRGARRSAGEICGLRWSDIDLDRGEVLIAGNVVRVPWQALVHKDTKTHAKRRVAVGAGTVELLRARRVAQAKDALACGTTLAADAYVFSHVPDGSAPVDPDGISHRFLRLARAAAWTATLSPSRPRLFSHALVETTLRQQPPADHLPRLASGAGLGLGLHRLQLQPAH
jgi:integrase